MTLKNLESFVFSLVSITLTQPLLYRSCVIYITSPSGLTAIRVGPSSTGISESSEPVSPSITDTVLLTKLIEYTIFLIGSTAMPVGGIAKIRCLFYAKIAVNFTYTRVRERIGIDYIYVSIM